LNKKGHHQSLATPEKLDMSLPLLLGDAAADGAHHAAADGAHHATQVRVLNTIWVACLL
jgi:hypothetical protein